MQLEIPAPENAVAAATQLLKATGAAKVFAFYGDMGAGKTTFIKALCSCMGVTEATSSPTFGIVNQYAVEAPNPYLPTGSSVYHFDFYRLKSLHEAVDMGAEDYFFSGNTCLIEWPDIIEALLPPDVVTVQIMPTPQGTRQLHINIPA